MHLYLFFLEVKRFFPWLWYIAWDIFQDESMQTNITTWLSLTGPESLPEFPWFVKLISCSLSSACCRIYKLQPALELPSVTWPRSRAHSSCSAQLQHTPRAAQLQETEGPDRNKAKSQSPHGALPPELRDPPDGTALLEHGLRVTSGAIQGRCKLASPDMVLAQWQYPAMALKIFSFWNL